MTGSGTIEVLLPQLGESVVEGTITRWLVKVGDFVRREQPLLEVATDKADTEVPSPAGGRVTKLLVDVGATVPVRTVVCTIDPNATEGPSKAAPSADDKAKAAPPADEKSKPAPAPEAPAKAPEAPAAQSAFGGPLASPDTRKVARDLGVDPAQLQGSGERGRITREDVLRAASARPDNAAGSPTALAPVPAKGRSDVPAPRPPSANVSELQALVDAAVADGKQVFVPPLPGVGFGAFKVPPYTQKPGDQIVPFTRRRRLTAAHMVYSKHVAPQVVTVAEVDVHKTAKLRDAHKDRYKREGVNLTYLAFIVAATATALKETPSLNARVLEDSYVLLRDINIGVAVDTPDGLVVPVIKRADGLNVRGIAVAIDEVAKKARDNKLTPDDIAGATFSVTNPGLKGNLFGGAIISQPNVGILRIGEMKKRPVVVEVDGVDTIAIHPVMYMALSYDHRIVDGVAANGFLWRVRELLEKGEFDV